MRSRPPERGLPGRTDKRTVADYPAVVIGNAKKIVGTWESAPVQIYAGQTYVDFRCNASQGELADRALPGGGENPETRLGLLMYKKGPLPTDDWERWGAATEMPGGALDRDHPYPDGTLPYANIWVSTSIGPGFAGHFLRCDLVIHGASLVGQIIANDHEPQE